MKSRVMLKMQLLELLKPFLVFAVAMLGISLLGILALNA